MELEGKIYLQYALNPLVAYYQYSEVKSFVVLIASCLAL